MLSFSSDEHVLGKSFISVSPVVTSILIVDLLGPSAGNVMIMS